MNLRISIATPLTSTSDLAQDNASSRGFQEIIPNGASHSILVTVFGDDLTRAAESQSLSIVKIEHDGLDDG